ncbi:YafY family transcriptional regulator [Paenibacillus oenotherae]|uniref:YafY family transcriptional regulator n=1 Tax=Paenibacillus oenotherae TaxID=1435645 RepID=A0ABS7D6J8_9BACL|nr:YafY family protein [Paenibacillus oenotherae]MBW7475167.1 YafY family transcriptional regulator [Paenibacillus oenotherae]
MSKTDNLLAILWLLTTRKRMTAPQLAEELEMSVRTVYRYIDALCASGVPVVAEFGREGGYSLLNQFVESPLFFDEEERKAMVHSALFARQAGYPYGEALERALTKIKLYTNEEQLDNLERYTRGFDVLAPLDAGPIHDEPVFRQLEEAVANNKTVEITYRKENQTKEETRFINPYGVVHWMNKWYVVAYCQLRCDIRSFRVDRVSALVSTDKEFERPEGFSAGNFFAEQIQPPMPPQDSLITVVIQGKPDAVRQIYSNRYWRFYSAGHTEDTVTFQLDEEMMNRYLPNFLTQYGELIRVVEPQALKERLAQNAAQLLRYYEASLQQQ